MATPLAWQPPTTYLAGEFVAAGVPLDVRNSCTGKVVGRTYQAGRAELERATAAAVAAFQQPEAAPWTRW